MVGLLNEQVVVDHVNQQEQTNQVIQPLPTIKKKKANDDSSDDYDFGFKDENYGSFV